MSHSLHVFLERFADIEADHFKARKTHGHEEVASLIWLWQVDRSHSFNGMHPQIMANLLVACIAGNDKQASLETRQFAIYFSHVFMDYNLRKTDTMRVEVFVTGWCDRTDLDLIHFGKQKLQKIQMKLRGLRAMVPKTSQEARNFLTNAQAAALYDTDPATYALW